MLGLTQTATLHKRIGRQDGVTVYAETGTEFACRIEESSRRDARNGTFRRNDEVRRGSEIRVFARETLPVEAGDCVDTGTGRFVVKSVRHVRRAVGPHHVEIICGGEG